MLRKCRLILFLSALSLLTTCLAPYAIAGDKSVALFPINIISPKPAPYLEEGMKVMLASRLAEAGLHVITDQALGKYLSNEERQGRISSYRVEQLASKVNAQYAIFGSLTAIGKGLSLDLSFLDLSKKPPSLTHVSEATTEDEFILRLAEVANRFKSIIAGKSTEITAPHTRNQNGDTNLSPHNNATENIFFSLTNGQGRQEGVFRPTRRCSSFNPAGMLWVWMDVVSLDVADLNGDDTLELLVLGRNQLKIYTRQGTGFKLIKTYRAVRGEDFLKVSTGDIDGDGRPEIYLVSFYGRVGRSIVFDWTGNNLKKRFTKRGNLVVVNNPLGHKPLLLYQGSKTEQLFAGEMFFMNYAGHRKLKKLERLPQLKKARFYTIIPYDINKDAKPEFIGLGEYDSLHIWENNGKVLWKEDNSIGGTNNAMQIGEPSGPGESKPWVYINSRLVMTDIDGDGRKDLIAVKNRPLIGGIENMLVYTKGRLLGYKLQGGSLVRAWITKQIPYCITDIQVSKNFLFIAAQKGRLKRFGKGRSHIMWFNLPKSQ